MIIPFKSIYYHPIYTATLHYLLFISNIIYFKDIYNVCKGNGKTNQMSSEEQELSFLNSVFVFKKIQKQ